MLQQNASAHHLKVLDGWRGISILLVLAAHLLPLGPSNLQLNETSGAAGMVIFFNLSGFLITRALIDNPDIGKFLIRRLLRILPLAWLSLTLVFIFANADAKVYLAHYFFYANIPPIQLADGLSHFWSLCVEMQFYIGIATVILIFGNRALYALPTLCLLATAIRVYQHAYVDIVTIRRIDEILAGCVLALIYQRYRKINLEFISKYHYIALLTLLAISSHPESGFFNYLRPYIAATLIGISAIQSQTRVNKYLESSVLTYLATISYALYIIHGILSHTWLGTGDKLIKYMKRPLLFLATFFLAHISTRYYEAWFIALGKNITKKMAARKNATKSS